MSTAALVSEGQGRAQGVGAALGLRLNRAVPIFSADIDECGTEMAHCRANQYCVNTEGSYECRGQEEVGVFMQVALPCLGPTLAGLGRSSSSNSGSFP